MVVFWVNHGVFSSVQFSFNQQAESKSSTKDSARARTSILTVQDSQRIGPAISSQIRPFEAQAMSPSNAMFRKKANAVVSINLKDELSPGPRKSKLRQPQSIFRPRAQACPVANTKIPSSATTPSTAVSDQNPAMRSSPQSNSTQGNTTATPCKIGRGNGSS